MPQPTGGRSDWRYVKKKKQTKQTKPPQKNTYIRSAWTMCIDGHAEDSFATTAVPTSATATIDSGTHKCFTKKYNRITKWHNRGGTGTGKITDSPKSKLCGGHGVAKIFRVRVHGTIQELIQWLNPLNQTVHKKLTNAIHHRCVKGGFLFDFCNPDDATTLTIRHRIKKNGYNNI